MKVRGRKGERVYQTHTSGPRSRRKVSLWFTTKLGSYPWGREAIFGRLSLPGKSFSASVSPRHPLLDDMERNNEEMRIGSFLLEWSIRPGIWMLLKNE